MAVKLTIEDLKTINRKPLESELSLGVLLNFYEECLSDTLFVFELDYLEQPTIRLHFSKDNLCHLLGFQHIFEGEPNASNYSGFSGYNLIKNRTITINSLKQQHLRENYKKHRERVLYFAFIYQLIKNPTTILFSKELAKFETNIETEFILYDNKNNRYLHLGLDKHEGTNIYFPRTFFVRKNKAFIENQKEINILKKELQIL